MRRTRTTNILACALVLTVVAESAVVAAPLAPVLAQAAPPVDDKAKVEAKQHFDKGVELMLNEHWDAALVEFTASLQLYPTKNARKNAANCLKQLGRFAEALDMYEQLLKEYGPQLSAEDKANVDKQMAELRKWTGFIAIEANVAGATVVVDGKSYGQTPVPPIRVAQGTHTIRVMKDGYAPFEATQAVLGEKTTTVTATLQVLARSGRIQIVEETGAEAEVIIDGAPKGKVGATPYEERIGPGAHWVALKGAGNLGTQPVPVEVQVDQVVTLRLRLEELPGEARIEADPLGAKLILDGVPVGQGAWEGRLKLGTHKIDATAEGYFRASKTFEITAGAKTNVKVALERDENSPFWTAGRSRKFGLTFAPMGYFGLFGLGSDYERNCSSVTSQSPVVADCYDRKMPLGVGGVARGSYELVPGLAIELEFGYAYIRSSLSRRTQMLGEPGPKEPLKVDITDEVTVNGFLVGVGASYTFVRRPIAIGAALAGGAIILGRVRDRRLGSTPCLDGNGRSTGETNCASVEVRDPPTTRPMDPAVFTENKTIPWFAPEIRVGYPVSDALQIGFGLGAFIALAEARPPTRQSPEVMPGEDRPKAPNTGEAVGLVPRPEPSRVPESAAGTMIVPRASLFVKLSF